MNITIQTIDDKKYNVVWYCREPEQYITGEETYVELLFAICMAMAGKSKHEPCKNLCEKIISCKEATND